jgi:hypothetical protein
MSCRSDHALRTGCEHVPRVDRGRVRRCIAVALNSRSVSILQLSARTAAARTRVVGVWKIESGSHSLRILDSQAQGSAMSCFPHGGAVPIFRHGTAKHRARLRMCLLWSRTADDDCCMGKTILCLSYLWFSLERRTSASRPLCASVTVVFLMTLSSARLSPTPTSRMFQFFSAHGERGCEGMANPAGQRTGAHT